MAIRPWQNKHFKLKDLLIQGRSPSIPEFATLCDTLADRLDADSRFEDTEFANNFRDTGAIPAGEGKVDVDSAEQFNYELSDLYDFCDRIRIWVD